LTRNLNRNCQICTEAFHPEDGGSTFLEQIYPYKHYT